METPGNGEAADDFAGSGPTAVLGADRARRPLLGLLLLTAIATTTGTFIYTYPSTLEAVRRAMIWVHDASGDLMVIVAVVYLTLHLPRTWRMWRRALSRWSGYVVVLVFSIAAGTGVYGQFDELEQGSAVWRTHMIASVGWIVLGSFHSAVGLLRRYRR